MHETLKEATYQLFEKTLSIYIKIVILMLWRNATTKKEWFPPTQFNKFTTVKQADLLGFELGQNICIVLSYWITS